MRGHITTTVLGGCILIMAFGVPFWARTDADEMQRDRLGKEIDKTIARGQKNRVQTLARLFNVAPGMVEVELLAFQGGERADE